MIRALSTAATGMEAQQKKLDVTANNIANVSTPGFKKTRVEFADLMYEEVQAAGAATSETTQSPTGVAIGMGVKTAGTERIQSQGSMQVTENPLDVAIEGEGFFPIVMPDGATAYTRAGTFKLNPNGQIVTSDGFALAGDISVPPDAQSVTIAADGAVSVFVQEQIEPIELGSIEIASFANPAGLRTTGKNLLEATAASGEAVMGVPGANGTGKLSQGMLEMSNVQVVEEMIDLIAGQRAYEVNSRVIRAADEMLQQAANLR